MEDLNCEVKEEVRQEFLQEVAKRLLKQKKTIEEIHEITRFFAIVSGMILIFFKTSLTVTTKD